MPTFEVGRAQTIEGYARGAVEADTPEEALRLARDKYRDGTGWEKEEITDASESLWTVYAINDNAGPIIESAGDDHDD